MIINITDNELALICRALHKQAFREAEIAIDLKVENTEAEKCIRLWERLKRERPNPESEEEK